VLFVSASFSRKVWTNHERPAAQERAIKENREYILPARFDDTPVPGLRGTIGHIDLRAVKPQDLAKMVAKKLGARQRSDYLPPLPDLLFRSYVSEYGGEVDLDAVHDSANHFLEALRRTNQQEREAVIQLFLNACTAELPDNVHINTDLLARVTGLSEGKLVRLFAGLRSLGFYSRSFKRGKGKRHMGEDRIVALEWHDMYVDSGVEGNATDVAFHVMNAKDFSHCDECALATLRRLDFSHLSSSTLSMEAYEVGTGRRIPDEGLELRKLHPVQIEVSGVSPERRNRRGARKKAK
jgi:hypothetical protein